MKKLVLSVCMVALLMGSVTPPLAWGQDTNTSVKNYNRTTKAPKSKSGATPSDDGKYASDAGDNAAKADMALTGVAAAVTAMSILSKLFRAVKNWGITQGMTWVVSLPLPLPTLMENSWFPIFLSVNIYSVFMELAHAAVNRFMRDTTQITASFTGEEGHVTDKWVGPGEKNKVTRVLGEFKVPTQRFAAIAFDSDEYKDLKDDGKDVNERNASARRLMEYRNEKLVEEQRSLQNVTEETWGLRYRAQQRSIHAMATALRLKEQLAVLAEADSRIKAEYGSKTQAVNTVSARRVLYDALMYLKMNVLAARTKTRAETLELDFKPVEKDPVGNNN